MKGLCPGGQNNAGTLFNFIILCCQELLGIQTLVCKLSLSQVHFLSPLEGSIPSTLESLVLALGRMQSLYLKKKYLLKCYSQLLACCSALILLYFRSIIWECEEVTSFVEFIEVCWFASFCPSAQSGGSSDCQYLTSMFLRTLSLPGCLFRPLELTYFPHVIPGKVATSQY